MRWVTVGLVMAVLALASCDGELMEKPSSVHLNDEKKGQAGQNIENVGEEVALKGADFDRVTCKDANVECEIGTFPECNDKKAQAKFVWTAGSCQLSGGQDEVDVAKVEMQVKAADGWDGPGDTESWTTACSQAVTAWANEQYTKKAFEAIDKTKEACQLNDERSKTKKLAFLQEGEGSHTQQTSGGPGALDGDGQTFSDGGGTGCTHGSRTIYPLCSVSIGEDCPYVNPGTTGIDTSASVVDTSECARKLGEVSNRRFKARISTTMTNILNGGVSNKGTQKRERKGHSDGRGRYSDGSDGNGAGGGGAGPITAVTTMQVGTDVASAESAAFTSESFDFTGTRDSKDPSAVDEFYQLACAASAQATSCHSTMMEDHSQHNCASGNAGDCSSEACESAQGYTWSGYSCCEISSAECRGGSAMHSSGADSHSGGRTSKGEADGSISGKVH